MIKFHCHGLYRESKMVILDKSCTFKKLKEQLEQSEGAYWVLATGIGSVKLAGGKISFWRFGLKPGMTYQVYLMLEFDKPKQLF